MRSLRQVALSGARWTLAARIGLQLVTWPITIVVMRLLEPGDYGVFAIAMLVQGFVALFTELGLGVALVQAPEVSEAQARMAVTLVLLLNTTIALVIVAIAPWVAARFQSPEVTAVMWTLTAELILGALAAVPLALLERELRMREISIAQMAGGIVGALVTLAAAFADFDVWALVAGALAGAATRCIGWIVAYGRVILPGQMQLATIRPMVRVSGYVLATRVLWYWSGQADGVVLGLLLRTGALGAYNVAAQLAMLPAGKAMETVNRVAFPILCRLRQEPAGLQATTRRLRGLLSLYGFGVCWGLAAVAPELVRLLLGAKWINVQFVLAALALVAPLRMLGAFHNTVVTAASVPEAATREMLFASVVLPGAVGIGAYLGGLEGAALAWPLVYPLVFALSLALTSAAVGERRRDALEPVLAPAAAGLLMLAAIWGCRRILSPELPLAALLALEICVGAAVYLAALWFTTRPLLQDARELALDLLRPERTA